MICIIPHKVEFVGFLYEIFCIKKLPITGRFLNNIFYSSIAAYSQKPSFVSQREIVPSLMK